MEETKTRLVHHLGNVITADVTTDDMGMHAHPKMQCTTHSGQSMSGRREPQYSLDIAVLRFRTLDDGDYSLQCKQDIACHVSPEVCSAA